MLYKLVSSQTITAGVTPIFSFAANYL